MRFLLLLLLASLHASAGASDEPPSGAFLFPDPAVAEMAESVARGDPSAIARAQAAGADVNARGMGGWSPIHYVAAYAHDRSLIGLRALRSAGADVNARSLDGETPLGIALSRRSTPDAAKILLSVGSSPKIPSAGSMPLAIAIARSDSAAFDLLLRAGAPLSWTPSSADDPGRASLLLARKGLWPWLSRLVADGRVRPRSETLALGPIACADASPSASAFRKSWRDRGGSLPCRD